MKQSLQEGLEPYLPAGSLPVVSGWINGYALRMKVTRGRKTKLGDYRPPLKDPFHRITVNHDLNPYEFLLTLTHEIAHMLVWDRFNRKARPHGKAWKQTYAALVSELLALDLFPADLKALIRAHQNNPKRSSKADDDLVRALHAHDPARPGLFLEELPEHALFSLPDGRRFVKQQKLRKWYRCQNLENKRIYRISPFTRVIPAMD